MVIGKVGSFFVLIDVMSFAFAVWLAVLAGTMQYQAFKAFFPTSTEPDVLVDRVWTAAIICSAITAHTIVMVSTPWAQMLIFMALLRWTILTLLPPPIPRVYAISSALLSASALAGVWL